MNSAHRELSWLELNRRFLKDALDPSLPLLERVKCLASFSSNLDNFFMVRVAELQRRVRAGERAAEHGGPSAADTLAAVIARVHELVDEQQSCFVNEIQPLLASEGIFLLSYKEATGEQRSFLEEYFRRRLRPILTPLAIYSGQPFPNLGNYSLSLVVSIRPSAPSVLPYTTLSVIHIPSQALPGFVPLPAPVGMHVFMQLEDVVRLNLSTIYTGYDIVSSYAIRTTRETDPSERRLGAAVRLQHDGDPPPEVLGRLLSDLELSPAHLFEAEGFAAFSDLFELYAAIDLPRLKDKPLAPFPARVLVSERSSA
jgi:polyphosphate kinase